MAQYFLTSCELFVEMVKSFIGRLARIRALGAVTSGNISMMASGQVFLVSWGRHRWATYRGENTGANSIHGYLSNCCSPIFARSLTDLGCSSSLHQPMHTNTFPSQSVRVAPSALEIVLIHEYPPFFHQKWDTNTTCLTPILCYCQRPLTSTSRPLQIPLFDSGALSKL